MSCIAANSIWVALLCGVSSALALFLMAGPIVGGEGADKGQGGGGRRAGGRGRAGGEVKFGPLCQSELSVTPCAVVLSVQLVRGSACACGVAGSFASQAEGLSSVRHGASRAMYLIVRDGTGRWRGHGAHACACWDMGTPGPSLGACTPGALLIPVVCPSPRSPFAALNPPEPAVAAYAVDYIKVGA